jgi:hypothetical protein
MPRTSGRQSGCNVTWLFATAGTIDTYGDRYLRRQRHQWQHDLHHGHSNQDRHAITSHPRRGVSSPPLRPTRRGRPCSRRLLPGLIDLVPNAVAATLLSAIASAALPRSCHGLQGGAAPPDQGTHGVMTGVGPKTGLNSPPSEGARGGCIMPAFLHLIAGLGPISDGPARPAPVKLESPKNLF